MAKITVNKKTKGSKSNQQKMATIQVSYQFGGCEITERELIAKVKEEWVESGKKVKDIITLNLYLNIEEKIAYYVINDTEKGKIVL